MEINDYIRTKDGEIGRIVDTNKCDLWVKTNNNTEDYFDSVFVGQEIAKSSKELIDLVEVGDIVNDLWVEKIEQDEKGKRIYCGSVGALYRGIYHNEHIKTIITHEQLDRIKYEVGE